MSPTPEHLLNQWLEGELDDEGFARLQRLLRDDPELRRTYYDLAMVEHLLAERAEGRQAVELAPTGVALPVKAWTRGRYAASLAAAAAIVLAALFLLLGGGAEADTGPPITASADSRLTIAQRQNADRW